MANINVEFGRQLLKEANKMLHAYAPQFKVNKDAWVWCAGKTHWEFHGSNLEGERNKFYWHGNAGSAYEARYKGWMAWFEKYYPQVMIKEIEEWLMFIYYDEINRRAHSEEWKIALQNKTVTFEQWKDHWLQTTLDWAEECKQSGYKLTYYHVINIYNSNK